MKTEWQVDSDGSGSGVILWFEAAVSDESVKPMLEERLESGMLPLLEELKHFSETGEAHPNKLASSAIA